MTRLMALGFRRLALIGLGLAALIGASTGTALAATAGGTPTPSPTYGHHKQVEKAHCLWIDLTGSQVYKLQQGGGYGQDKGQKPQTETYTATAKALVCETTENGGKGYGGQGGKVTLVKVVPGTASETEASQGGH